MEEVKHENNLKNDVKLVSLSEIRNESKNNKTSFGGYIIAINVNGESFNIRVSPYFDGENIVLLAPSDYPEKCYSDFLPSETFIPLPPLGFISYPPSRGET